MLVSAGSQPCWSVQREAAHIRGRSGVALHDAVIVNDRLRSRRPGSNSQLQSWSTTGAHTAQCQVVQADLVSYGAI